MGGTNKMRGSDVVQILSAQHSSSILTAEYESCRAHISCLYDVFVHIKHACKAALRCNGTHIMDTVDLPPEHGFAGHIFETDAQLGTDCTSRCCAAIPHLFNLNCRSSKLLASEHMRTNGSVAVLGWTPTVHAQVRALRPFVDLPLEAEPKQEDFKGLCPWYETRVRVAIAWKTNNKSSGACERFTNPIWLNLPTIGHVFYDCQRELDPDGTFLCGDGSCVNRTIESFRTGSLDEPFQRLVQRVKLATRANTIARMYASFFRRCTKGETVRQRVNAAQEVNGAVSDAPLQGNDTGPSSTRGIASTPKPAQCIEGTRAHLRYYSSKLERQWLSWPDGAAGHICEIAALQHSEAQAWLSFAKRAWSACEDATVRPSAAAVPQRSPRTYCPLLPVGPVASEKAVLSAFHDGSSAVAEEYIEPLSGVARHPLNAPAICKQQNSTSPYLMDATYLVLANHCSMQGNEKPLCATGARKIFYDLGCSVYDNGKPLAVDEGNEAGGPSLPLFAQLYERRCIEFDAIFGWEASPQNPSRWWQHVRLATNPRRHTISLKNPSPRLTETWLSDLSAGAPQNAQ